MDIKCPRRHNKQRASRHTGELVSVLARKREIVAGVQGCWLTILHSDFGAATDDHQLFVSRVPVPWNRASSGGFRQNYRRPISRITMLYGSRHAGGQPRKVYE